MRAKEYVGKRGRKPGRRRRRRHEEEQKSAYPRDGKYEPKDDTSSRRADRTGPRLTGALRLIH